MVDFERESDRVIAGEVDFYKVLGVARTATTADIRKAFRVKAKGSHPDKGGDSSSYGVLQKAYEILSDEKLRRHYDSTGRSERSLEEDFLEHFNKPAAKSSTADSHAIDLSQRMIRPKEETHTSGFEEWMRSRDQGKSVITDDYLQQTLGVSKAAYEVIPHKWKHPSSKLVRRQSLTTKFLLSAKSEDCVEAIDQRLRRDLEWGEVLVNVIYAPINPYDLTMLRVGEDLLWSYHSSDEKQDVRLHSVNDPDQASENDRIILGSECVARVTTVGPGVKALREGDYVTPLRDNLGTWQTAAIWRERDLLPIPSSVPVEYASVSRELFLAYHLLQHFGCELQAGDAVVLNAANSMVGQAIIQFCKLLGIRAIAIIRRHSDESFEKVADYLSELGANRVYAEDDAVRNRLLREHASLPKLALDAVGGPAATVKLVNTLQEGGKVIVYGSLSGQNFQLPWHMLVSHDVKIQSFYLTKWMSSGTNQKIMANALEQIGKLLDAKKLIVNTKEYRTDEFEKALAACRVNSRLTKIILTPPSLGEEEDAVQTRLEETRRREEQDRLVAKTLFTKEKTTNKRDVEAEAHSPSSAPSARPTNESACRDKLSTVIIPPSEAHRTTVVFLHNRGEVPEEYETIFKRCIMRDERMMSIKVVLPEGPMSEEVDGEDLPCWCNDSFQSIFEDANDSKSSPLRSGDLRALQAMEESCDLLAELVESEIAQLRGSRVVLAGFDQGAVVALFTALTKMNVFVAAVVCFNLPQISRRVLRFLSDKAVKTSKTKIFFLNGTSNSQATPSAIEKMSLQLQSDGFTNITAETIPNGTHVVAEEQLSHMMVILEIIKAISYQDWT